MNRWGIIVLSSDEKIKKEYTEGKCHWEYFKSIPGDGGEFVFSKKMNATKGRKGNSSENILIFCFFIKIRCSF